MKAYGSNIVRNGTRAQKHACCDIRNGCYHRDVAASVSRNAIDRAFKRRARAEGKAQAKAGAEA